MDEGKNQKCAFQKIKFALDLSSEMVRQQTLESVFYFEHQVDPAGQKVYNLQNAISGW